MDKGAHFYCCDFQIHTPRDRQWHGEVAVSDEERNEYAEEFISKCRELGINAVAITDHHDVAFIDYIRVAAANEKDSEGNTLPPEDRLVVFPGVELTLGIPCQALLIFDSNLPRDALNMALTRLGISPAPDSEAKCAVHGRLDDIPNFNTLHELLDTLIKGRYIVIPNVSDGSTGTLLRHGLSTHYKTMPCVGGYLDGSLGDVSTGKKNIIEGRTAEYGHKPIGVFQTSDNRYRDFRDLGRAVTYVKWANPTAEALRQACLARKSRISQERPLIPLTAITSISVSNSSFMGPINVDFNRQYNAIIGGRGTGKSTLLEYMRWALCDEMVSLLDEEGLPSYQRKRENLIRNTLTSLGSNVQVDFVVNDVPHSVRRDSSTNQLLLRIGREKYEPCTEPDIRSVLPIQAYSQKQLSSVGTRLEELQRFIRMPVVKQLDQMDQEQAELASEMRTTYSQLLQKRLLQRAVADDERLLQSISQQTLALRKQLTGISEDEQTIMAQYDLYMREGEIIDGHRRDISNVASKTNAAVSSIDQISDRVDYESLPNQDLLLTLRTEMNQLLSQVKGKIQESSAMIDTFLGTDSQYTKAIRSLQTKHDVFLAKYEDAKEKSSVHESIVRQLGQLEEQQKEARARIQEGKVGLIGIGDPETAFSELHRRWFEVIERRATLLQQQCNNLTRLSDKQIRASLRKGVIVRPALDKLRLSITGSRITGSKIDGLGRVISLSENPLQQYQSVLDELELLATYNPDAPSAGQLPATPILSSSDLNRNDIERMAGKLNPESWLELCLTRLDDEPVFEYRVREDDYISFQNASAGQQATSLLWTLLNQDGPPLVIDQPEDDLDNQVMLRIAEKIWDSKKHRQLLFTSHNANIVVNGDAELVICCDYRVSGQQSSGDVKLQGAIDINEVRDEITRVMEGGEEAFKLRKEKYGF